MALPSGVTAITGTTGPWIMPDGSIATGRAFIRTPINNRHLPTGTPIASGDNVKPLVAGRASWPLIPNDEDGLLFTGDWEYTLFVQLNGARVQPDPVPFVLLQNGPLVVDLDGIGTGVTPSPVGLVGSALVGFSTIAA